MWFNHWFKLSNGPWCLVPAVAPAPTATRNNNNNNIWGTYSGPPCHRSCVLFRVGPRPVAVCPSARAFSATFSAHGPTRTEPTAIDNDMIRRHGGRMRRANQYSMHSKSNTTVVPQVESVHRGRAVTGREHTRLRTGSVINVTNMCLIP